MSKITFPLVVAPGSEVTAGFDGEGLACTAANQPSFELGVDGKSRDKFTFGDKYFPAGGYTSFQVFNPAGTPLVADIVAFSGEYSNEQAVGGGPQSFQPVTLDQLRSTAFVGQEGVVGLIATSRPAIQVFNPAASNKLLAVTQIELFQTAAGNATLGRYDTELVNPGVAEPQYFDGPASIARFRSQDLPNTEFFSAFLGRFQLQANTQLSIRPPQPYVVIPGTGFAITGTAQQTLQATMYFLELSG